jgi:hypothetical protein
MNRTGTTSGRHRPVLATLVAGLLISTTPALAQPPLGFSVRVDGDYVAGDPIAPDATRRTDVRLAHTDIQVKFDGLDVEPVLNVVTSSLRRGFRGGETVEFRTSSNYPSWIERTEIRIYAAGTDPRSAPLATLPASPNGLSTWQMPATGPDQYVYVARVYDAKGHVDETKPLTLIRTERIADGKPDPDLVAAGWGDDHTAYRTIPVFGGGVNVYGTAIPPGGSVIALGEPIPVDKAGKFVVQRILPTGDHIVDVAVNEAKGSAMQFQRAINIPANDWFYVGMADLTIGRRDGSGIVEAADPGEFGGIYTKGRLSFYLKGKIKGEYLLTAAADTGEGPLGDLFTGALSTDPQAILRRIDPKEYYPVYGDDSTMVDDAPTQGKLYVRLERGPSHVMWGNFRTEIGDSAFLRGDRALYGASAVYNSDQTTPAGKPRASASAYAARPGTVNEYDVMRGTGGSAYFLRHQDLAPGSESLVIEQRDAISGALVSSRPLSADTDYRINYMQGLVLLTVPLPFTATSGSAVQGDANLVNLVAQYEYTPADAAVDDMALGGHAEAWLNDHVWLSAAGTGGASDGTSSGSLISARARVQSNGASFAEAEIARSEGDNSNAWATTDGGLTYVQQAAALGGEAYAYRLDGKLDLADFSDLKGEITGSVEQRQAGFSSPDRLVLSPELLWDVRGKIGVTEAASVAVNSDHYENADGTHRSRAGAELDYQLDPSWTAAVGLNYVDQADPGDPTKTGQRADAGVRLTYRQSDDLSIYGFGQGTVWRAGELARNDRAGVGAELQLTEALKVGGEISAGTTGPQAAASLTYYPTPDERDYIIFRLAPQQDDDVTSTSSQGSGIVVGTERRYSDVMAVQAERNFQLLASGPSVTNTYGVTLTPDKQWTGTGLIEVGTVSDPVSGDFDRKAVSLGVGYKSDGLQGHARGEVRLEDSVDNSRDRQTYLLQGGLDWKASPDWHLLTNVDAVISNSDQSATLNGDYVEASIGYAYRPVDNNRLNLLARYTYLYDLPGPDQVNSNGDAMGPAQRSNIFSIDANFHLYDWLTLGAKYGFRIGEVSPDRDPANFSRSSAHLAILRADAEIIRDWDLLLEGRVLYQPEAGTADYGAVAALSYDFGNNLRVGGGYNFGLCL